MQPAPIRFLMRPGLMACAAFAAMAAAPSAVPAAPSAVPAAQADILAAAATEQAGQPDKDRPRQRQRRSRQKPAQRQPRQQQPRQQRRTPQQRRNRQYRRTQRYDWRRYYRQYPRGKSTKALPRTHRRVRHNRTDYYYHSGVFYRRRGDIYVVVAAPIGLRLAALPYGYISFWIGPARYYYVNDTYYRYDPFDRYYVVVAPPSGASAALHDSDWYMDELVIYPERGQSPTQRARDRRTCYNWAVTETGIDPAQSWDYADSQREYFLRAMAACLEARGYTVR